MNENQRAVLAHVVIDPDAWWSHVQAQFPDRADQVLAEKVSAWQASYDAASAQPGYQPRARRDKQSPAFKI